MLQAFTHEENWGIARGLFPTTVFCNDTLMEYVIDRLLMPAFSTAKMRDMFDDMLDIAQQMVTKWERYGFYKDKI